MSKKEKLNIVDEKDNIIGEDTRENIHKKGLLRREVHVWLYNNEGGVLFQKRALNKDTFPGLLDASIGGHVELNETYEEAAIKEAKEETDIMIDNNKLIKIIKTKSKSYDKITNTTNNVFRIVYAYKFNGVIKDIKREQGKAIKFEFWSINKIINLSPKETNKFIPSILKKRLIFEKIKKLIK